MPDFKLPWTFVEETANSIEIFNCDGETVILICNDFRVINDFDRAKAKFICDSANKEQSNNSTNQTLDL